MRHTRLFVISLAVCVFTLLVLLPRPSMAEEPNSCVALSQVLSQLGSFLEGTAEAGARCASYCEITKSDECGKLNKDTCSACCQPGESAVCTCEGCGFYCERAVCRCK